MKAFLKTISWRIIATCITAILVCIMTGSFVLSFIVALPETIIKMAAYYGHERAWAMVKMK